MKRNPTRKQIVDLLNASSRILVTSHVNPDFDAVGSMLAIGNFLRARKKDVTLYNASGTTDKMLFLPGAKKIRTTLPRGKRFDATLFLDAGTPDRFGPDILKEKSRLGRTVKIDHHETSERFTEIDWTDPESASTGELVAELIERFPASFSPDVALCLYVAIVTDTGGFRYSNTNSRAMNTAAKMLDAGVNAWDVTLKLYETRPAAEIRLLAEVLSTLSLEAGGRLALMTVSEAAMKRTGADAYMTDGFINYGRAIEGVEVAVLFHAERSDRPVRVSFRSKGGVNVARITEKLGGGGHANAGGATLDMPLDQARERVIRITTEALRSNP